MPGHTECGSDFPALRLNNGVIATKKHVARAARNGPETQMQIRNLRRNWENRSVRHSLGLAPFVHLRSRSFQGSVTPA